MYLYNPLQKNQVAHLFNPLTGKSFCKAENNKITGFSTSPTWPAERRVCNTCSVMSRKAPNVNLFYKSSAWRQLRYAALAKYGNLCSCCGASPSSGAVMHVDHIKPISRYPELALNIDNLQVLCAACNLGKSNRDQTTWRRP